MIGATLHRILNRLILKVPSENMGKTALLSIEDIPFWITFQGSWLRHIQKLNSFQQNLKTREWTSLGVVYPRTGTLAYSFYLFSWADYCGLTDTIISQPDDCLFAEVFLSYICQIDSLVDNPSMHDLWKGSKINKVKLSPEIASTISELCAHIQSLPIPHENRILIFKLIINYRRNALNAMRRWAFSQPQTIEDILEDKKNTACGLLATWSNMLCAAYNIREEEAQGAYNMFLNFSFLVQIVDDIADSAIDHRNSVQNIFIAYVQQTDAEWVRLREIINSDIQYIGWRWIRKNLPISHQKIKQLYNRYAELLTADQAKPEVARSMLRVIECYRGLMEWNL